MRYPFLAVVSLALALASPNAQSAGPSPLLADGQPVDWWVTTSGSTRYAIFGDLNQHGSLAAPKCNSSQDGRGGLFYVVNDATLTQSIGALIKGDTAPAAGAFSKTGTGL